MMRGANKGKPIRARFSRSRGSPNVSYASRRIAKLIQLGIFATSIISCWAGEKKGLEQEFIITEDGGDATTAKFEVRFGDHEAFVKNYEGVGLMNIKMKKEDWEKCYSLTLGNQKKYLFRNVTFKSFTTSAFHFTLKLSHREYITGSESGKEGSTSRYTSDGPGKIKFELDLGQDLEGFKKKLESIGFENKDPPAPKKREEPSAQDDENLKKSVAARERFKKLAWQDPTDPEGRYEKDEELWCVTRSKSKFWGESGQWVKIIGSNEKRELELESINDGRRWKVPSEDVTFTRKQEATDSSPAHTDSAPALSPLRKFLEDLGNAVNGYKEG